MNGAAKAPAHEIYPKRYFPASKTWWAWNKLTIADVFALREEPSYRGQNVYFWLNHPMQFVRLVGMVLQFDSVANGKFVLVVLDDFSGANIEVKIERRQMTFGDTEEHPSNTLVENLDVDVRLGETFLCLNKKPLELGAIVMVRCTITSFNDQRQALLKRMALVQDTNEEAVHWSEVANWKTSVLSSPWTLTTQERQSIDDGIRANEAKERERERKKRKAEAKRAEAEKRGEQKRDAMAQKYDAHAIADSHLLPDYTGWNRG